MTWAEIGEIAADPLATIGAHTVNHVMLRKASDAVVRSEMQQSAAVIEAALGKRPAAFQLSGRRPHLGGPARVSHRGRARLQDRGDDAARRAVSRACRAPDRAAAHFAQRRIPAAALRQGAAVGRRDRAVEPLPPGGRGLDCFASPFGDAISLVRPLHPAHQRHRRQHPAEPGDRVEQRRDPAALRAQAQTARTPSRAAPTPSPARAGRRFQSVCACGCAFCRLFLCA